MRVAILGVLCGFSAALVLDACGGSAAGGCGEPGTHSSVASTGCQCDPSYVWEDPLSDSFNCVPETTSCDCNVDSTCTIGCQCDLDCGGCTPVSHATAACYSGDLYWYDSCGAKEGLKENCGVATCADGACGDTTGCGPEEHGDGLVCHCGCATPDPDCDNPDLFVSGCVFGQVCTPASACTYCGNGTLNAGEECDPGVSAPADCAAHGYGPGSAPCTDTCKFSFDACPALATCGNAALDPGELCDGARLKAGLSCDDFDFNLGSISCDARCGVVLSLCSVCGDGDKSGTEACDDRDRVNGDGCSTSCAVEPHWTCTGSPSACTPTCGDGFIIGNESCDDGDHASGDGCSASCRVETNCQCAGEPSICSCLRVETVATTTATWGFDYAALALDDNGAPKIAYLTSSDDFSDPVTGYSMRHSYLRFAEKSGSSWSTSAIETWDESPQTKGPASLAVANAAGTIQVYYQRLYHPQGPFALATRSGTTWTKAYDPQYHTLDVLWSDSWRSVARPHQYGTPVYREGTAGDWRVEDDLSDTANSDTTPTLAAYGGAAFLSTATQSFGWSTYEIALRQRAADGTWPSIYSQVESAPAGSCNYPVDVRPVALPNGDVVVFEEGFDGTGEHWLRLHARDEGHVWRVEEIADLSWATVRCTASSGSYTVVDPIVTADHQNRIHVVFASARPSASEPPATLDYYIRDAALWHTRKLAVSNARVFAAIVDDVGTLHLLAEQPSGTPGTRQLAYVTTTAGP
jgi:cysteine-rich repeat protein